MPVVMLVIVSPPSDAKTDQRDETSAEQDADTIRGVRHVGVNTGGPSFSYIDEKWRTMTWEIF